MEQVQPKRKASVRAQIILVILAVQIPLLILYTFLVTNMSKRLTDEQITFQRNEQTAYINYLTNDIQAVGTSLYVDFWEAFGREEHSTEEIEKWEVEANKVLQNSNILTEIAIYQDEKSLIYNSKQNRDQSFLNILLADDSHDRLGWNFHEMEDNVYMYRIMERNNYRVIVGSDINRMAANANNIYHLRGSVVFANRNNYYNSTLWLRNANAEIPSLIADYGYFMLDSGNRQYTITEDRFMGMRVLYGVIYRRDWSWMYFFGILLGTVAIISAIVSLIYLRKSVFNPLKNMTTIMSEIGQGNLEKRLPEMKTQELSSIGATFNEMMDKLEDAKIETYEQQLVARKAKTDSLRLQIRRHFFLNCLKNIYAMASVGDIDGIKSTALLLSTNLRYTLNFDADTVELQKELEMCKDYIKLQGIGQNLKPELMIESDPRLDTFLIPPVSLLTIMENSCKYGNTASKQLVIKIQTSIKVLDEQQYAIIAIQDNGPGYSEEMLRLLNRNIQDVSKNNHVGLANTLLRFRMMYGEETTILFANNNGAKIEIFIPMKEIESGVKA